MTDCKYLILCADCCCEVECLNKVAPPDGCCDNREYWGMEGCLCEGQERIKCNMKKSECKEV